MCDGPIAEQHIHLRTYTRAISSIRLGSARTRYAGVVPRALVRRVACDPPMLASRIKDRFMCRYLYRATVLDGAVVNQGSPLVRPHSRLLPPLRNSAIVLYADIPQVILFHMNSGCLHAHLVCTQLPTIGNLSSLSRLLYASQVDFLARTRVTYP